MASKGKKTSRALEMLVSCNMELIVIEAEVKALKEGLIKKKVFDNLMSLKCKVPIAERYTTLLVHVHETLQERLKQFELHVSANPDSGTKALATKAVVEGLIKKDILVNIASLNEKVPASLKVRYLLVSMQANLQAKLESYRLHMLTTWYCFTEYKHMWLKLDEYIKIGLIREKIVTSFFPSKERQAFDQYEVTEQLKYEKSRLNHSILASMKAYGKIGLSMLPSQSEAVSTLGSQHLIELNELLVSYSYNWKNIGLALNFQPQDLLTIEASPLLLPSAPKSYLIKLLQDWLQRTLKHTLPPTVENLKKALGSQIVGLGALSSELQAIASKSTHSFADCILNRPYSSTIVSFDAEMPSFFPLHNEIYIEEGECTLLEIRAITKGKEDPVYNWLRKGIRCGSLPILYLNADISFDCDNISCEVSSTKLSSVATVPITVHVSCPLIEFTPSLSSIYLCKPEVPEDTWPPTGNTKYINLAIIKQQKVNYGSEYTRFTIRGDMDDVLLDKETIDYDKIYASLKWERQVLFIEGRPGSGKTSFVHKISHDWASNSSGGIRILLLVSLRVLNTVRNPNLSDILSLFRDLKVAPELIESRDGKGVCFIFDGLDEFSPSDGKDSIVYKIIDRSYLHRSTVVVASRPAALAKLRNKADKIVEVVGFLGNQIQEYFDHYPFSDATKPVKLKSYLSLHPNVLHMCYLPIHACIVAFLFKVTGEVPKTETEMYMLFTRSILMRNISKNKEIESIAGSVLQCLNEEEKYYFKQICQLAWDKTLSNKQVLHQEDIRSYFQVTKKGDISLGLITIDCTADLYGFKDIYTFLHLTFQEYLAAYHISTLSDEVQKKMIEEHGQKNHMLVVWRFFCGLVDIKPFTNKFKTILHKTQGNTLYHFQCAYESQNKIVCAQLLKDVHYNIQLANKFLSIPDFTSIGYVTNKTIVPVKLSLTNCDIDIVAVDALLSEMENKSKNSLQSLHIEDKALNSEVISKLLANFPSLKSLSIVMQPRQKRDSLVEPFNPQQAREDFLALKKIQTLSLNGFGDEFEEFQMLMLALRQCENLTELNLTHNKIGKIGAKYLTQSLPCCISLQRIDISNNGMTSDSVIDVLCSMKKLKIRYIDGIANQGEHDSVSMGLLLQHLKPFTALQSLDMVLEKNHVDHYTQCCKGWGDLKELRITIQPQYKPYVTSAVSRSLQLYFHNLEIFVLKNAINDIDGAKGLAAGLQQCSNLKVLNLNGNLITLQQLEVLLSVDFLRLEELYLGRNFIQDNAIILFSLHLKKYQFLQKLCLNHNSFSSSGAKVLAAELHHCTKLVKLDLQGNWLDNDAVSHITAGLKLCTNFRSLCISRESCEHFAINFEQENKQNRKEIFGCDSIEFV